MRLILLLSVSVLVASIALPTDGSAQSFNCNQARTATEHAICANRQLSNYDDQMAEDYGWIRRRLSNADQQDLRAEQRFWLHERNRCGGDYGCLSEMYEGRISDLEYWYSKVR
ncbi:MAG: lysozyme inhibitor LprI family protein [Pseudomonadota bacterium]